MELMEQLVKDMMEVTVVIILGIVVVEVVEVEQVLKGQVCLFVELVVMVELDYKVILQE
jgi:hypothetical protein